MKSKKAKIGLAAALGGLVATSVPILQSCAMCYDPAIEEYVDYVCPHCGDTIRKYNDWTVMYSFAQIENIVNQMKGLEYDVVLDKTEFCPHCSDKSIENPELIFKIRFSDEADYHIARSNIVNEYQYLLEFLTNPEKFLDEKTDEKIAIIRKMTGLGEDLKIE